MNLENAKLGVGTVAVVLVSILGLQAGALSQIFSLRESISTLGTEQREVFIRLNSIEKGLDSTLNREEIQAEIFRQLKDQAKYDEDRSMILSRINLLERRVDRILGEEH